MLEFYFQCDDFNDLRKTVTKVKIPKNIKKISILLYLRKLNITIEIYHFKRKYRYSTIFLSYITIFYSFPPFPCVLSKSNYLLDKIGNFMDGD